MQRRGIDVLAFGVFATFDARKVETCNEMECLKSVDTQQMRLYAFDNERRYMPRPKTIPEGRKNHLAFGVSAEFLKKLDQVRGTNAEWEQISDGQLVKRLALLKMDDLLNI